MLIDVAQLNGISDVLPEHVFAAAPIVQSGYAAVLFFHKRKHIPLCTSVRDPLNGYIQFFDIRLGSNDGVKVGYLFHSPYPITVTPQYFRVAHHSMYDQDSGKLLNKKETLKPVFKLPSLFLMRYGSHGLLGLATRCTNDGINKFLNLG